MLTTSESFLLVLVFATGMSAKVDAALAPGAVITRFEAPAYSNVNWKFKGRTRVYIEEIGELSPVDEDPQIQIEGPGFREIRAANRPRIGHIPP